MPLTLSGKPGAAYVLERSTNLLDWVAFATNTVPVTGLPRVTNSVSVVSGAGFIRARTGP